MSPARDGFAQRDEVLKGAAPREWDGACPAERGPDSRFRARSVPGLPPSTATLVSRPVLGIEFARGVDPGVSAPDAQRSVGRSGGAASRVVGTLHKGPRGNVALYAPCRPWSLVIPSSVQQTKQKQFPQQQQARLCGTPRGPGSAQPSRCASPGRPFPSYYSGFSRDPTGLCHPRPRGTQALALFSGRLTTDAWVLGFRFLSHVLRRTKQEALTTKIPRRETRCPAAESWHLPG